MKFIILSLLLAQFFAVNCLSQTRITTKSGNTFIGFIQSNNDVEIELLSLNNEKVVIPMSSVIKQELLTLSVSTKSGMELSGTLTRISDDDFDLRTEDGIQMTIRFDGVEKFKIDDPEFKSIIDRKIVSRKNKSIIRQKNQNTSISNIPSEYLPSNKSEYQKLGLNFGTPAGINIIYGITSPKLGFHLSGGYWEENVYGFQIGPSLNLGMNENSELNLVVTYGILKIKSVEFNSFNVLLDANIYGLHFEFGFGLGDGNVRSPQLLFQIGYAFRWAKQ